jgi:hypothetical protein
MDRATRSDGYYGAIIHSKAGHWQHDQSGRQISARWKAWPRHNAGAIRYGKTKKQAVNRVKKDLNFEGIGPGRHPLYARENPMKESTKKALWIGGIALGAVAIGAGVAYVASKPAAAAPSGPTPSLNPGTVYDASRAVQVLLTPLGQASVVTVAVGTSVAAMGAPLLWNDPGVTTSDSTVLAPSIPGTTNGFVAVKEGTATLTGSYMIVTGVDQQGTPIETQITVSTTVKIVKSLS